MLEPSRNTTNCCTQLRDLLTRQIKHFFGFSGWSVALIILLPAILAFSFFYVGMITKLNEYPDFDLEKLKHPVYNTAYLHEDDEFYADFNTTTKQQLEFESFF